MRRAWFIFFWLIASLVAAWIFWPVSEPTEQDLMRLVPRGAMAVIVQRDLGHLWPRFRQSASFRAWTDSPWMPVRASGSARSQHVAEQALLDLVGERAVCFVMPSANGQPAGGVCVLTPVTWRVKWLWLRAMISQHWRGAGFEIHTVKREGHAISEVSLRQSPAVRPRFARVGDAAAIAIDGSADSMAALFAPQDTHGIGEASGFVAAHSNAVQCGFWQQKAGHALWTIEQPDASTVRFDLELPLQHVVRLPWDATRGPRSMALIQKLFPDQGVLTVRGRASHWMGAWDNLATWAGLPASMQSENLILRVKYGEHLSHGQFPWSGAGDECACAIDAAGHDTPAGWPTIVGALRCWEPHDTQVALEQELASLSANTHDQLWIEPMKDSPQIRAVRALQGAQPGTFFYYRYAGGLVLAGNSLESLRRYDPSLYDNSELEPTQPENQLVCHTDQLGAALQALGALDKLGVAGLTANELNSLASILKTLSEVRVTIRLEKETVNYQVDLTAGK